MTELSQERRLSPERGVPRIKILKIGNWPPILSTKIWIWSRKFAWRETSCSKFPTIPTLKTLSRDVSSRWITRLMTKTITESVSSQVKIPFSKNLT
jgi:hypothetical protein